MCGFFKEKHKTGFIDLTAAASFLLLLLLFYRKVLSFQVLNEIVKIYQNMPN